MAIAIDTFTTKDIEATSITIDKPTGVVEGDLMVAQVCGQSNAVVVTPPAGWTEIQQGVPASAGPVMASYYRVATSSEGASYNFTLDSSSKAVGGIVRITGATVIDTSSEQYNDTPSTTITGGTVTPTYADSYILFLTASTAGATSGYAIATANPASWTELYDISRTSVYGTMAWASRPETSATGNATATTTSSRSACHILVIKPFPEPALPADTTNTSDSVINNLVDYSTETSTVTDSFTPYTTTFSNKSKNSSSWTNKDKS